MSASCPGSPPVVVDPTPLAAGLVARARHSKLFKLLGDGELGTG